MSTHFHYYSSDLEPDFDILITEYHNRYLNTRVYLSCHVVGRRGYCFQPAVVRTLRLLRTSLRTDVYSLTEQRVSIKESRWKDLYRDGFEVSLWVSEWNADDASYKGTKMPWMCPPWTRDSMHTTSSTRDG